METIKCGHCGDELSEKELFSYKQICHPCSIMKYEMEQED